VHQEKATPSRFEQIVARLPAGYRQGKMPYVFLFGLLIVGVLLLHVATNAQQAATPMFLLMAGVLLLLLAMLCLVYYINLLFNTISLIQFFQLCLPAGGLHCI
jgi:hypothetical protein